jgi:hypothetical protein
LRTKQERTCVSCGNEFITTNIRQIRCRKDCGRKLSGHSARAASRLINDITFVGVDGEGVDRPDGTHEYVMLSVGQRTLWEDGNALTLGSILSFLWECYTETPDAAFVGFFLGYDFIMWQKLLPEKLAWSLLTSAGIAARKSKVQSRANPFPDAVVWEGWEIDIMAGRRFKLRPHVHHKSDYTGRCRNRTCNVDLETTFDPLDPILVPGEMEWELDEYVVELPWNGWTHFRRHHTAGQGKVKAEVSGWMYICDTGPFWQTSFLNVINPKGWGDNAVCTEEEYQTVVTGKSSRGTVAAYGDSSYYSDMQKYNVLENDILARVTDRLNKGFMNDAIPIKIAKNEWYGPGRAAQLWMDQLHAKVADPMAVEVNKSTGERFRVGSKVRANECGLLNADVYQSMPAWFGEAARSSYYGGWFEQMVHGHVGDVWEYDINSAYPYVIASLPCLHTTGNHNGQYTQGTGAAYPRDPGRYTLVFAECMGSNPYIGALPFRTKQGNILRPHHVKGWYWLHEIQASQAAGLIDTVTVERWVSYLACQCTTSPFNPEDIGITRMYQLRLAAGKNSPEGKALKLVYNSAYGKTAQSIGAPKYSNPVYASLITAGCRTLILQAIASHPSGAGAVTMVATDGIYFTERHPTLSLSATELGLWDEVHKHGMTQLMPGVYWDDKTREAIGLGGAPSLKSRGVNAKDLAKQIHQLDGLFAHQQLNFGAEEYQWPTINFTINFQLTSAKLALQRGKWNDAGRVDHGATRSISANPGSKRMPEPYRDNESGGIIRTRPYDQWEILESTPYNKAFGYQSVELDGPLDRDGRDPLAYFRDIING